MKVFDFNAPIAFFLDTQRGSGDGNIGKCLLSRLKCLHNYWTAVKFSLDTLGPQKIPLNGLVDPMTFHLALYHEVKLFGSE